MSLHLRRAQVVSEALSWQGTPYHHCADVLGAGVDCAMLLVRVYAACELIPADLDPRPYAPDWHLHRSEEAYLGWLAQHAQLQEGGEPEAGDIVVWRFGRCFSHAAIVLERGPRAMVIHAWRPGRRVMLAHLADSAFAGRESRRYRPLGLLET